MVHHCICIKIVCTVCVCIQSGVVNHAQCALALLSVLPMCSLRGAATYGHWHGSDDCFIPTHFHSSPTQDNNTTSCWGQREKMKTARLNANGSMLKEWLTRYWIWNCCFIQQRHTYWIITFGIMAIWLFTAMWVFKFCSQRQNLQGWSPTFLSMFALCLCQGCRGLEVWTMGGERGQNTSGFSVPLVLLLTETGVAQDGASEGATPAPNAEHEDDNSLGYTGTAAALPWSLSQLKNVFSRPDLHSAEWCMCRIWEGCFHIYLLKG